MANDRALLGAYRERGQLTVPDVFSTERIAQVLEDLEEWKREVLGSLSEADKRWYLERGTEEPDQLRKLDHPAHLRPAFRALATDPALTALVEDLIGPGLVILFSQVFLKPGKGGGPKPCHQDNFYFAPRDEDAILTAWVALDDAGLDNGCLNYWPGSHRGGKRPHSHPEDEPFNLQVAEADIPAEFEKTPTPVASRGVSFHHGWMLHQSSQNLSGKPRRAVAFHYMSRDNALVDPPLPFDQRRFVEVG
ncbi:MAG: phytanoyl-CoA dioxygenase family protein [Bryobacterales bacterium]